MRVHVVGAGIAGLLLARELVNRDISVYMYEEDRMIGKPEHCTGLVSEKFLKLVPEAQKFVLGKYRRIEVVDVKFRRILELNFSEKLYVIDRGRLEQYIYDKIASKLERALLGYKVVDVTSSRDCTVLKLQDGNLVKVRPEDIIAICEGARQALARRILRWCSSKYVYGVQADCKSQIRRYLHDDTIYVVYDFRLSDLYFAWIIPIQEDLARIGLGCRELLDLRFSKLVRLARVQTILKVFGGKILLDTPPRVLGVENIVLLGDSVSQVKPLTGGGNTIIALTTKLLSKLIVKCREGTLPATKLSDAYSRTWWRTIGKFVRGVTYKSAVYNVVSSCYVEKVRAIANVVVQILASDFDLQSRYIVSSIRLVTS